MALALLVTLPTAASADMPATYTIVVTPQELALIARGLRVMPYNDVVGLLDRMQAQVAAQNAPPKPPEEPK